MAGIKGKSGGPRKNAGGARPGAGRPKKKEKKSANEISERDMLQLLQDIALGRVEATHIQVRAAIAAVQYTHAKKAEGSKKEEEKRRAAAVASKYSRSPPPKLVYSKKD